MDIYEEITRTVASGRSAVIVTIIKTSGGSPGKVGFKMLVTDDGRLFGTVGGGALERFSVEEAKSCLKEGVSRSLSIDLSEIGMECGGKTELFFDFLAGRKPFVLFGGGHVGRALSKILLPLGFEVHVFDNRPEVIEALSDIPGTHPLLGDYKDISPILPVFGNCTYCFIATHGHEHDQTVLRQVLATGGEFTYVGMIGSAKKVQVILSRIEESGIPIPDFVYSPVGLAIGGDSAAEIAVSIAAEVIAVSEGAQVPHMRDRLKKL